MSKQKPTSSVKYLGKLGLFHVEQVDLTFTNGVDRTYFRLAPRGTSVDVVAYDDKTDELVLIEEFAGGTLEYEIGIVRGGVDFDEDIIEAAHRELSEEAHLKAKNIEFLKTIFHNTGYNRGYRNYVLATGLSVDPNPLEGDEPEPITVIRWPVSKLDELLVHPRFRDGSNMLAILLFKQWYEKNILIKQ